MPDLTVFTRPDRALPERSSGLHIAYLSTYPPRECGLATFCEDLLKATALSDGAAAPMVVAMEREGLRYRYQWPVSRTIDDHDPDDYEAAAQFINRSSADVVSLQHEFGIYGGREIEGICRFLETIEKPVVSTLHTVLPQPDAVMRSMIRRLAQRSERVVVFNDFATDLLEEVYGVARSKVVMVHHGAPAPHPQGRAEARARLGLSDRRVISTFGLISRGKGIEYALAALPALRKRHPEVLYLIIGETHPGVRQWEKESYREELARFVNENDLQDSVHFVNHYLTKPEIISYLAATDVYLTPYIDPHQIVSGTLAYAAAAGCAVVSTPYLYARFLLHDGRGTLVGFRNHEAIAEAVTRILDDPALQQELQARTLAYGQQMLWPAVGARYHQLFSQVVRQAAARRVAVAETLPVWTRV